MLRAGIGGSAGARSGMAFAIRHLDQCVALVALVPGSFSLLDRTPPPLVLAAVDDFLSLASALSLLEKVSGLKLNQPPQSSFTARSITPATSPAKTPIWAKKVSFSELRVANCRPTSRTAQNVAHAT